MRLCQRGELHANSAKGFDINKITNKTRLLIRGWHILYKTRI